MSKRISFIANDPSIILLITRNYDTTNNARAVECRAGIWERGGEIETRDSFASGNGALKETCGKINATQGHASVRVL